MFNQRETTSPLGEDTNHDAQSGYLEREETDCYIGAAMRDVEVLRITSSSIVARGRRYGRMWFLKGIPEELRDSTVMRRRLIKEFEILSRLRHEHIVQAAGLEEIEELGLCIVQEWVEGQNLHTALRNGLLSAADKRRVIHELTLAVAHIHRHGIVHRDIKPANVMIRATGGEVVLVDFGLADTDDYFEIKGPAGTSGFISPEQETCGGASATDDIYSMGVVMREMTPRYRRIANLCTGPVGRRPKDGTELLKALTRRDRRQKSLIAMIASILLAVVAILAIWRIKELERTYTETHARISTLNEKNMRNEGIVEELRDSLTLVRGQLNDSELKRARIVEYEQLRQNTYKEGCRRIKKVLDDYDRNVFSKLTPEDIVIFSNKALELNKILEKTIADYDASISGMALKSEDCEKLILDLKNYYVITYSDYYSKWQKRVTP